MSRQTRQCRQPSARVPAAARRGAFTLLEASLVTLIVGVGVVALIELLAAGTMSNIHASDRTIAIQLVGNIREVALDLNFFDPQDPKTWSTAEPTVAQYDDIKDLDGKTFSPPLNGRRQPSDQYAGWSQVVTVETVAEDYLESKRPRDPEAPTVRVTVTILHHGRHVYQESWLAAAPAPAWPPATP